MAEELENMQNCICRACRNVIHESDQMISMYAQSKNATTFSTVLDLFTAYTTIEVDKAERTACLCINCYKILIDFHEFRRLCSQSHVEFLKEKYSIRNCSVQLQRYNNEPILNVEPAIKMEMEDPLDISDDEQQQHQFVTFHINDMMNEELTDDDNSTEVNRADTISSSRKIQTNSKQLTCSYCYKQFATQSSLRFHLKTSCKAAPIIKRGQLMCPIQNCDFRTTKQSTYSEHIIKHEIFKCPLCDSSHTHITLLNTHVKIMHRVRQNRNGYTCVHCGTQLLAYEIEDHMLVHPPTIGKQQTKQQPQQSIPNHEGIYKCNHCLQVFGNKHDYMSHEQDFECQSNFICTICNARKTSIPALQLHLKLHRKQTDIVCEFCSENFESDELRASHRKRRHFIVKRNGIFFCACCGVRYLECRFFKKRSQQGLF